jgi:hypothetical protein
MELLLIVLLLIIVILLTTNRETYTESFGLSGYKKPTGEVMLTDARPNLNNYIQEESVVSHDMIEEFVSQANKQISERTGLCTYIIETTSVKKYSGTENDIYECVFFVVKNDGFAFGFSVYAAFEVNGDKTKLVSLRSQPLDTQSSSDIAPFIEGTSGKEFIEYELVKQVAAPTVGELENAKNKLQ